MRFVVALLLGVAVQFVLVLGFFAQGYQNEMHLVARDGIEHSRGAFDALIDRDVVLLSAVVDSIMTREDIRRAFAQGDREKLLATAEPLYAQLSAKRGVTHMYFEQPDGTVFLRVHKPSEFGDVLTRSTFKRAKMGQTYGTGLELGRTAFALRVVHPIFRGASTADPGGTAGDPTSGLLGYVEAGEEIDHLLMELREQTGDEVILLLSKSRLDHDAWSEMRGQSGLADNWDEHPDFVVAGGEGTLDGSPDGVAEALSSLSANGVVSDVISPERGRSEAVGAYPIVDATGDVAGAVYVVSDMSVLAREILTMRLHVALVILVVSVSLTSAILVLLDRLVFSRLKQLARRLHEFEGSAVATHFLSARGSKVGPGSDELDEFESSLARYRQELEVKSLLLDEASDSILLHELGGRIVYANRAASRARGYSADEFLGAALEDMISPESAAELDLKMERLLEEGESIFESDDLMKDGTPVPVEVHARVVEFDGLKMVASVVRDLTERRESERLIERLAYHDSLTGLANRELFLNQLSTALARMRRSGGSLCVAFIDLDRLKSVNDTLGHAAGDEVLSIVGERLAAIVREGDSVARMGGDEFVLVIEADETASSEVGERVLSSLRPDLMIGTHRLHTTASVGMVFCSGGCESSETLIRRADLAMYAAKRAGGDRYCVYNTQMAGEVRKHLEFETDLADSIDSRALRLHYQPILTVPDGIVVAAEALLRWTHPVRGEVPPAEFVPLAEECGLIVELGEWALREACSQAAKWRADGLTLRVAVNISLGQFLGSKLDDVVMLALEDSGLPASSLELEITESAAMHDSPRVQEVLRALRRSGVVVSVDDFGSGYSSLGHVSELQVDALKVDRSFVERMDRLPESWAIVKTIVSLGQRLGLVTVAEGVETPEQFDLLGSMGCALAQGLLFAPALSPEDFWQFIADRTRAQ